MEKLRVATEEQMAQLYARLLSFARAKKTASYSEIASIVGLNMDNPSDRDYLGHLLGYISSAEAHEGRPMLSSVVLHKGENTIGQGFQRLGIRLGLKLPKDDEDSFLVREMQRTFSTWRPT
jgi:hypothetical protein